MVSLRLKRLKRHRRVCCGSKKNCSLKNGSAKWAIGKLLGSKWAQSHSNGSFGLKRARCGSKRVNAYCKSGLDIFCAKMSKRKTFGLKMGSHTLKRAHWAQSFCSRKWGSRCLGLKGLIGAHIKKATIGPLWWVWTIYGEPVSPSEPFWALWPHIWIWTSIPDGLCRANEPFHPMMHWLKSKV